MDTLCCPTMFGGGGRDRDRDDRWRSSDSSLGPRGDEKSSPGDERGGRQGRSREADDGGVHPARSRSCPDTGNVLETATATAAAEVKPEKPPKRRYSIFNLFRSWKQEEPVPCVDPVARDDMVGAVSGDDTVDVAVPVEPRASESADHSPERPTRTGQRNSIFNIFSSRKKRPPRYSIWHDDVDVATTDLPQAEVAAQQDGSRDDLLSIGAASDASGALPLFSASSTEPLIRDMGEGTFYLGAYDNLEPEAETSPTAALKDACPSGTTGSEVGRPRTPETASWPDKPRQETEAPVKIVIRPPSSSDQDPTSPTAPSAPSDPLPVLTPDDEHGSILRNHHGDGHVTEVGEQTLRTAEDGGVGVARGGGVLGSPRRSRPKLPPLTLLQTTRPGLSNSVPNLNVGPYSSPSPPTPSPTTVSSRGGCGEPRGSVGMSSTDTYNGVGGAAVSLDNIKLRLAASTESVWYDDTQPARLRDKKRSSSSVDDLLARVSAGQLLPRGSRSALTSPTKTGVPRRPADVAMTTMALRRRRAHSDITSMSMIATTGSAGAGSVADDESSAGLAWASPYVDAPVPTRSREPSSKGGRSSTTSGLSTRGPSSPQSSRGLFGRFFKRQHSGDRSDATPTLGDSIVNPFILLPSTNSGKPSLEAELVALSKSQKQATAKKKGSPKAVGITSPLFRRKRSSTVDVYVENAAPETVDGQIISVARGEPTATSPVTPPTATPGQNPSVAGRSRSKAGNVTADIVPPSTTPPLPPPLVRKRSGSLPNTLEVLDYSILAAHAGQSLPSSPPPPVQDSAVPTGDGDRNLPEGTLLPNTAGKHKEDKRFRKLSAIFEWESGASKDASRAKDTRGRLKYRQRGYSQDMGSVAMFGRKPHGDVRKSAAKVLDPKKDTVTRLKHLRIVLETYDVHEAKAFFDANYSHIYYIFYDVFISVESDLKQRANKAHREELDMVLYIFEKILTFLPELIHKRWQYHSIGRLMKKLLHTGNSIRLRREGMRLFLIWYEILMDNATEECHRTYASLVPKLGSEEALDMDIFTVNNFSDTDRVTAVEISAMLPPQSGEKQPDNLTKWLLESLLMIMVSEVNKVEWTNKETHEYSFTFLFNKFKEYYLHNIFPDFKDTTIYDPCLDLPQVRSLEGSHRPHTLAMCQEAVVRWMATFTHHLPRPEPVPPLVSSVAQAERMAEDGPGGVGLSGGGGAGVSSGVGAGSMAGPGSMGPGAGGSSGPIGGPPGAGAGGSGAGAGEQGHAEGDAEGRILSSNATTLSAASSYTEKDSASSSVCSDEPLIITEYDIVRRVLYSTRENVNIVHEVFRQALLFPFNHSGAIRRVIQVYKDWLQDDNHRPPFMLEPVIQDGPPAAGPASPPVQALPQSAGSAGGGAAAAAAAAAASGSEGSQSTAGTDGATDIYPETATTVASSQPPQSTVTSPGAGTGANMQPTRHPSLLAHLHDNDSEAGSASSSPSKGSFTVPENTSIRNRREGPGWREFGGLGSDLAGPVHCRAGVQRVIQVFITNASNVFLLEPSEKDGLLEEQVDLCKRVLNIYRLLVMSQQLDQRCWEQLLLVLLHITNGVLTERPPNNRDQSRGGRLAQPLFQTLIVTWIKANLNVYISSELWDQFLAVLSSLTQWVELIKEWAKTMETLTRVLARQVYNLDLNDLPLDRQKGRKRPQRGKGQSGSPKVRSRTFSRGWSRHEPVNSGRRRGRAGSGGQPAGGQAAEADTSTDTTTLTHTSSSSYSSQCITDPKQSANSVIDGAGGSMDGGGSVPLDRTPEVPSGAPPVSKAELVRQRSLSQEQSPSRSRRLAEVAGGIIRSSSDTNLMGMEEKKSGTFGSDLPGKGSDSRSLNEEMVTSTENGLGRPTRQVAAGAGPTAADEEDEELEEDGAGGEDSLSGSFVSSYGEYSTLHGAGSDRLQESQSSMYFSAPEDLELDSPSVEEATDGGVVSSCSRNSATTAAGAAPATGLSDEEGGAPDDKAVTMRDSVVSEGEVFLPPEYAFQGGAARYMSDSSLSASLLEPPKSAPLNGHAADDEPDRAVLSNQGSYPTQPSIVVTSPGSPGKGNNVWKGPFRKKSPIGNRSVKQNIEKKNTNKRKVSRQDAIESVDKERGTQEVVEQQQRQQRPPLDGSLSDGEPTAANLLAGTSNILLLDPGPAEEESSTDTPPHSDETSVNVTAPEDQEVASVTASLTSTITDSTSVASVDSNSQIPYHILDRSGDSSGIGDYHSIGKGSLDNKSDTDVLLRISESRSPSPPGSKGSRPGTPITNGTADSSRGSEMEEPSRQHGSEHGQDGKEDSPGPDRMSLHLDDMEPLHPGTNGVSSSSSSSNGGVVGNGVVSPGVAMNVGRGGGTGGPETTGQEAVGERPEDIKSVLAGGLVVGWTADVAVILWRRMLGALGDVNQIVDPEIHARVFECLCDLLDTMLKMRDNMAVSKDNQVSPAPPELLPPIAVLMPWLFEALSLGKQYQRGKLLAYRLLCMATVRNHDMPMSMSNLTRFYRVLHHGLVHTDQDTTNTLVRHCGPRFFSLPLTGSTMLILDFVHAANTIASTTDLKEAPRAEAVSILGSLICIPNHFGELMVLQPNAVDMTMMQCNDVKDHVISMLLKAGKKEPSCQARYIAISCVGIFLYEELTHHTMHSRLKEAVNVLLAILRFNNKCVAQVAADMLMLLCDHVDTLLKEQPDLPRRIIEVIATVISSLLPSTENSNSEDDKRLLVSIMFVLLEWCMRVPLELLMETPGGSKSLIYKTFKVLNMVVTGTAGTLTPRGSVALPECVAPDDDVENLRDSLSNPTSPRTGPPDSLADYGGGRARRSPTGPPDNGDRDMLKLAARTVMCHLVNHLGHFPMGGGAAQLNSEVQEHHDMAAQLAADELTEDIFNAPNVQFFVVNNTTLVSFVEIPAWIGVPGGGVTAGLTTGKTETRVIIRDAAGKFCWDSTVLYGPPRCRAGSYPAAPQAVLRIIEDIDLLGREPASLDDVEGDAQDEGVDKTPFFELPMFKQGKKTEESLDTLLDYIGQTSPECLLRPGEPLNVPDHPPEELTVTTQTATRTVVLQQKDLEEDYHEHHQHDSSMVARALEPMEDRDPSSPFQLCRLYLNQLGLMQWSKRPHFDLLKKDGKLLRELKNLDHHKCRETHKIAVIYVAKGQEDKQSILTNTAGSTEYERFVAGLGWEVDLETHAGFMGGLQRNKSTGDTAPYYATSTREVIYHVSTRMPSATPEDRHRKLRHLGNDEVQIIWSEHTRDYRRGIIPTEFGDVLLIIYPLHNGLFRIQINRKPEVPYFGPLFDGAIVDRAVLPGLVRATALNAGHLMRSQRPFYQAFYEERAKYVENIVQNQRETATFEDFSAHVFAPVLPNGGDMIGAFSTSDLLHMHPGHFGSSETDSGKGSSGKMSPQTSVKAAKGDNAESATNAFSRRLSFGKSRKSSIKQNNPQLGSPPDSPSQNVKAKK